MKRNYAIFRCPSRQEEIFENSSKRVVEVKDNEIIINPLFDFPTPAHHNYDMVDGIEYTIKVSNPHGQRIISLIPIFLALLTNNIAILVP